MGASSCMLGLGNLLAYGTMAFLPERSRRRNNRGGRKCVWCCFAKGLCVLDGVLGPNELMVIPWYKY